MVQKLPKGSVIALAAKPNDLTGKQYLLSDFHGVYFAIYKTEGNLYKFYNHQLILSGAVRIEAENPDGSSLLKVWAPTIPCYREGNMGSPFLNGFTFFGMRHFDMFRESIGEKFAYKTKLILEPEDYDKAIATT